METKTLRPWDISWYSERENHSVTLEIYIVKTQKSVTKISCTIHNFQNDSSNFDCVVGMKMLLESYLMQTRLIRKVIIL